MRAACVSSVLCTRVLVCKAQSRETTRRQGSRQDPVREQKFVRLVRTVFRVHTLFSLRSRFLQIGKVWSHFGKISKRKALGHSAKGWPHVRGAASTYISLARQLLQRSSSSGTRMDAAGRGARSRTRERGTPAQLGDRSARLSYRALAARARGNPEKVVGKK